MPITAVERSIRGQAVISNTDLLSNTAGLHGGAIHSENGQIELYGGLVRNNRATWNGGALNVNDSISISGTRFISNSAGVDGGAILQWNGPLTYTVNITNALFERNTSGRDGGGVWIAPRGQPPASATRWC